LTEGAASACLKIGPPHATAAAAAQVVLGRNKRSAGIEQGEESA
jgi:hypothetical protein